MIVKRESVPVTITITDVKELELLKKTLKQSLSFDAYVRAQSGFYPINKTDIEIFTEELLYKL